MRAANSDYGKMERGQRQRPALQTLVSLSLSTTATVDWCLASKYYHKRRMLSLWHQNTQLFSRRTSHQCSDRFVKMELDFLASLEDAEMNQVKQQSMDLTTFENLASADPRSDKVDLHLSSTYLEPLYLGLLLCLGSWYLVGFSAPIQWASIFIPSFLSIFRCTGKEDEYCTGRLHENFLKQAERFRESSPQGEFAQHQMQQKPPLWSQFAEPPKFQNIYTTKKFWSQDARTPLSSRCQNIQTTKKIQQHWISRRCSEWEKLRRQGDLRWIGLMIQILIALDKKFKKLRILFPEF